MKNRHIFERGNSAVTWLSQTSILYFTKTIDSLQDFHNLLTTAYCQHLKCKQDRYKYIKKQWNCEIIIIWLLNWGTGVWNTIYSHLYSTTSKKISRCCSSYWLLHQQQGDTISFTVNQWGKSKSNSFM